MCIRDRYQRRVHGVIILFPIQKNKKQKINTNTINYYHIIDSLMLSHGTKKKLAQYIQSICEAEKRIEIVRQVLCEQKQFELSSAFKRIDQNRDDFISTTELIDYFDGSNLNYTTSEVVCIFKYLDFNADGLVSFQDFVEQILPKEDEKLKSIVMLRQPVYLAKKQELQNEVEWGLVKFFEQLIKNYRSIEKAKYYLQQCSDFAYIKCFNCIDDELIGHLNRYNLNKFLQHCDINLDIDEIDAFIRAIGNINQGKVTYTGFQQVLEQQSTYNPYIATSSSKKKKSSSKILQTEIAYSPKRGRSGITNSDYQRYLSISQEKDRTKQNEQLIYQSPIRSEQLGSELIKSPEFSQNKERVNMSPLRESDEKQLVQTLRRLVQIDREIEDDRKSLALKQDFNLMDAFRILDKQEQGMITLSEFQQQLSNIGIYLTQSEFLLLFNKFHKKDDVVLSFSEFVSVLLPESPEYAEMMRNRKPQTRSDAEGIDAFKSDTQFLFKKIIRNCRGRNRS
eukprot:TRINITY_DN10918_c0_g3_i4.p1 TRINITY_DN10918_c0_g3~~TRINITY_DN10918_c0_g3_i4.p1  ORF type:complete len:523 (-),score=85.81 TRINITY_DN10918_c0_g3_i4:468-1991(-)